MEGENKWKALRIDRNGLAAIDLDHLEHKDPENIAIPWLS